LRPIDSSDSFSWRAHPAVERPRSAIAGLAVIALLAASAAWSFGLAWGIGSFIALLLSLNRFFLPSRFTVTADVLIANFPFREQRLQWSAVRRFVQDANGGFLSTRHDSSRVDAFRGLHLLFGSRRDEAIRQIEEKLRLAPSSGASSGHSVEASMLSGGGAR